MGGPLFPYSAFPTTNNAFANVHVGAGANSKHEEGMGISASLAADTIWRLRFQMPPALPSGQCKIVIRGMAAATANSAKVNPKWASVAAEEDPSAATLNAETVQTVTWAAGDSDVYKETKVNLDADTPVANEVIVMDLTFETSGWTLNVVSTWQAFIIWE